MKTPKWMQLALIVALGLGSSLATASFRNGYMSPQDLLLSLKMKFAGVTSMSCQVIGDQDRPTLGDLNPSTGEPLSEVPGTAFITFWDNCIDNYFSEISSSNQPPALPGLVEQKKENVRRINEELLPAVLAPVLEQLDTLAEEKNTDRAQAFVLHLWFPEDPSLQKRLIATWVEWALGTDEEILAYGKMKSVDQFRADLLKYVLSQRAPRVPMSTAFEVVSKVLFKRDEFLLYY